MTMGPATDRIDLKGRVVIVTGGAQGIGLGVVSTLVERGASVACLDHDADAVEDLRQSLGEDAGRHLCATGDALSPDGCERFLAEVTASLGTPWGLVNNVGGSFGYAPFVDLELEDFEKTLRLNLCGTFLFSQGVIPAMIAAGGGSIVNIASIAAERAIPLISAYSTAKAGVLALTRSMAVELAGTGITVNAVEPGHVLTGASLRVVPDEIRNARDQVIPVGRHGTLEEIGEATAFLLAAPRYLTGVVLPVDGGMTASMPVPRPPDTSG